MEERSFHGSAMAEWTVRDDGIYFLNKLYKYENITTELVIKSKGGNFTNGVVIAYLNGERKTLTFKGKDYDEVAKIVEEINSSIRERKEKEVKDESGNDPVYQIKGARGRHLDVYSDKAIITVKATVGSFITGNVTDGEKTIYFEDIIGIQFKKTAIALGYLQLETASMQMNNKNSNFFSENSFTFDTSTTSNAEMEEVSNFIKQKVEEIKHSKHASPSAISASSNADEIRKYKGLLDDGIISQEEFDQKKKELLGL